MRKIFLLDQVVPIFEVCRGDPKAIPIAIEETKQHLKMANFSQDDREIIEKNPLTAL
jgi:hypothetical protein